MLLYRHRQTIYCVLSVEERKRKVGIKMRDYYIRQKGKETLYFATFDEMIECFNKMDECDKHFCTVHDDSTGRYAPGYDIVWAHGNLDHAFKHVA